MLWCWKVQDCRPEGDAALETRSARNSMQKAGAPVVEIMKEKIINKIYINKIMCHPRVRVN